MFQAANANKCTPKVTRPGPLAFGLKPSMLSFSVGSDLFKDMPLDKLMKAIIDSKRMDKPKRNVP